MFNFIKENFWSIVIVVQFLLNIGMVYLLVKYDVLRKERKFLVLKYGKKLVYNITGIDISSDDAEVIIEKINAIEKSEIEEVNEELNQIKKSEELDEFLKGYFKKRELNLEKRKIRLIAEIFVNIFKKYGV